MRAGGRDFWEWGMMVMRVLKQPFSDMGHLVTRRPEFRFCRAAHLFPAEN
jgi:hypothetical protein